MSISSIYSQSQRLLDGCSVEPSQKMDDDTDIVNLIWNLQQENMLNEEKRASRDVGLPDDPRMYNSSQVKIWASRFMYNCDIGNAGEILSRLEKYGVNGATLAQWKIPDFKRTFGDVCGDIMHNSFQNWISRYKKHHNGTTDSKIQLQNQADVKPSLTLLEGKTVERITGLGPEADLLTLFFNDEKHSTPNTSQYAPDFYNTPHSDWYNSHIGLWHLFPEPINHECSYDYTPRINDERQLGSIGDTDSTSSDGSVTFEPDPDFNPNEIKYWSSLNSIPHQPLPVPAVPEKRKRGRPRKPRLVKPKRTQPILYKFILLHLALPESTTYVEWVNRSEGIFRFHSARKDDFAQMWGLYKRNREPMTYQNMARALRNYTKGKRKIMERVRRKLHYKFCAGYVPSGKKIWEKKDE